MWDCPYRWPIRVYVLEDKDMMGKSIPLSNGQWKEWIYVVTDCSWYLDEMEGMHVSCHSNRVIDMLRKGNSNQVIHYFVEKD